MATKKAVTKKTPTKKLVEIEEVFFNGSQSIEMKGTYKLDKFRIKIVIDRDSYDSQSSAALWVWKEDKLEWSVVTTLHSSEMAVCGKSGTLDKVFSYTKASQMTGAHHLYFRTDKEHLIKLATQILF